MSRPSHAAYSTSLLSGALGNLAPNSFSSKYPRPKIQLKLLFREISVAELLVGPERVSFHAHLNLLVSRSTFFKAALASRFEEAHANKISMPEDDPEIVDLFVQWCYTGDAPYSCVADRKLIQLIRLYCFADKYMVPRLRNDLVWHLFSVRHDQQTLPTAAVEFACNHLPDTSPLLPLLAAWYAWHAPSAKLFTRKDLESLPSFSAELNLQHFEKNHDFKVDPFTKDPSIFYEKIHVSKSGNDVSYTEIERRKRRKLLPTTDDIFQI